ncbi:MAG TPA: alpha-L-fucosidase [Streptosporangiaceae bacterium]|nr:alpha-L-fucosidase [Streptosporangiaceae bacterium]
MLGEKKYGGDVTLQPWFERAKLGIFVHWGIYAVRGIPESWSFFNGQISYDDYMNQPPGHFYGASTLSTDRRVLYLTCFDRPPSTSRWTATPPSSPWNSTASSPSTAAPAQANPSSS